MYFWDTLIDRIKNKIPPGTRRRTAWRLIRNEYIKNHPVCAVCECKKNLEVHHIIPIHIAPDLELEMLNLVTLCTSKKYGLNCHLLIGHLGNFRRINPDVHNDIILWNRKIKNKI